MLRKLKNIYCGVEKRLSRQSHKLKIGCSTQPSRNQTLRLAYRDPRAVSVTEAVS